MEQLKCPLDGQPCATDCPDRYQDQSNGGCFLTTAAELGAEIHFLDNGTTAIVFRPEG